VVTKALFSVHDVYEVIESQKRRLKEAYQRLPEDEAFDDSVIQQLKAEYMLHVPILITDQMYCVEGKTKVDARRNPNRVFLRTGPVMEEVTELTVHIPFSGDPGVFNIAPSARNGQIADGEIVGMELLLRVLVADGSYDVQAHIDRELTQIKWALTHLREKDAYASQELGGALSQAVAARRRSLDARNDALKKLKLPLRSSSETSQLPPPSQKKAPEPTSVPAKKTTQLWDVFISHASEDKPYVEPLAQALASAGVSVWYDSACISWGDDIRVSIDDGLLNCDYGIVVFSKAFLAKRKWTEYEVSALFGRETVNKKRILPIWHDVSYEDVVHYSPALAQRLAKSSANNSHEEIVNAVLSMLERPITK
jgi:hypothetical protein